MSKIYERTEINATTKEAAKLTDTMKDTLAKLADQGWAFIGASTVKALLRRGLITANTAPRDPSQGVWCHYMLTDAGREAAGYGHTEGTENGVTTIVSLEGGVAEAERASTDRQDDRVVDLVLVDARIDHVVDARDTRPAWGITYRRYVDVRSSHVRVQADDVEAAMTALTAHVGNTHYVVTSIRPE